MDQNKQKTQKLSPEEVLAEGIRLVDAVKAALNRGKQVMEEIDRLPPQLVAKSRFIKADRVKPLDIRDFYTKEQELSSDKGNKLVRMLANKRNRI